MQQLINILCNGNQNSPACMVALYTNQEDELHDRVYIEWATTTTVLMALFFVIILGLSFHIYRTSRAKTNANPFVRMKDPLLGDDDE
jgi:hypothetical protein